MNNRDYINNQNNWLKIYIDTELKAVREAVTKVEITNKEAVDKVERNYAEYRANQNEWRGQIKDQSTLFVTRRELWTAVIALAGIVISILHFFK